MAFRKHTEKHDLIAEGVTLLQQAGIDKPENKTELEKYPEHVEGIVSILRELANWWVLDIKELITQRNFETFILHREFSAKILQELQLKLAEFSQKILSNPIDYLDHPEKYKNILDQIMVSSYVNYEITAFLTNSYQQQASALQRYGLLATTASATSSRPTLSQNDFIAALRKKHSLLEEAILVPAQQTLSNIDQDIVKMTRDVIKQFFLEEKKETPLSQIEVRAKRLRATQATPQQQRVPLPQIVLDVIALVKQVEGERALPNNNSHGGTVRKFRR